MQHDTSLFQHEPLVHIHNAHGPFAVQARVNTKEYYDAFMTLPMPSKVCRMLYAQSGRVLNKANGTELEYMVALDTKTGALITENLARPPHRARATRFQDKEIDAIEAADVPIVVLHNHPSGAPPSFRDLYTAAVEPIITASVIVGHDGSIWYIAISNTGIASELMDYYNTAKDYYGDLAESKAIAFVSEHYRPKHGFVLRKVR